MKFFLELQLLIDDLVDFPELTMFINASILPDGVGRELKYEKKEFCLIPFVSFFKIFYG